MRTQVIQIDPKELKLLEKNARYMSPAQFGKLVDNLKRDGALTSVPLVAATKNGQLEVLSGNHRVRAAIEAGITTIQVMELLDPITENARVGIQLSHNAIVGQDDPNLLAELYRELDFEWKDYSGLSDEILKELEDLALPANIAIPQPEYVDVWLSFLPTDKQIVDSWMERAKKILKKQKPPETWVAEERDWEEFLETFVRVKLAHDVLNAATAFRLMVECANKWLTHIEAEAKTAPLELP